MRKLVVLLGSMLFGVAAYGSVTVGTNGGNAPSTESPGTSRYTYTTTLQSDVLQSGDFFIVYDFLGYKPGSMAAPSTVNWSLDTNAVQGPAPSAVQNGGQSSTNLVWTYQGAAISAGSAPVVLGQFAAESTVPYRGALSFASLSSSLYHDPYFDFGTSAPEPGSMFLVAAGLCGVVYLRKRRTT